MNRRVQEDGFDSDGGQDDRGGESTTEIDRTGDEQFSGPLIKPVVETVGTNLCYSL